jgi:hypothetical protein
MLATLPTHEGVVGITMSTPMRIIMSMRIRMITNTPMHMTTITHMTTYTRMITTTVTITLTCMKANTPIFTATADGRTAMYPRQRSRSEVC